MKTALVLGGAGFLGSHLIPKLLERGYKVDSVDPENYKITSETKEPIHRFNYAETWETFQSLAEDEKRKYDLVFHLAACLTKFNIDERNKLGIEAFADTQLDYSVATWLAAYPPKERVVWMSSSATDAHNTENYAFVKYVSERFARQLGKGGHVPVSILKPYAGYGPGQSLNYPMSAIIDRALRHEDPLKVWGDAKTERDWIYVDDLIDAILMAADGAFPPVGAMPIGTGVSTTFGNLARIIAEQVGYSPSIKADMTKPVGSGRRVAQVEIAKSFGFQAKVTLEEGIARCIAAARSQATCPWCGGEPHAPTKEKCEEYRKSPSERAVKEKTNEERLRRHGAW